MSEQIQLLPDFKELLQQFVESRWRNQWLMTSQVAVYVRKNKRVVRGRFLSVLDIGTIDVSEQLQGHGLFKQIFALFQSMCGEQFAGVYLENVLNPDLQTWCRKVAATEPTVYEWNEEMMSLSWVSNDNGRTIVIGDTPVYQ